jgi:hypothetical protein
MSDSLRTAILVVGTCLIVAIGSGVFWYWRARHVAP